MSQDEFNKLPPAQQAAMLDLHERSGYSWDEFLKMCLPPTTMAPYVGVKNFHGRFVGIEADGYTHT